MKCPQCGESHNLSQCPRWRVPACDNCTRAHAGMWCGYSADCHQCTARAIARSSHAFNALHPHGDRVRDPLRELIERAMHDVAYADARRAVWAWWVHDHPEAKAHAA